jgi:hypothetical protein
LKQVTLPPSHYAASWKTEGVIKTIPEVNDLGRRYAELLPALAPCALPAQSDFLP